MENVNVMEIVHVILIIYLLLQREENVNVAPNVQTIAVDMETVVVVFVNVKKIIEF
jgi:hypothetical protein